MITMIILQITAVILFQSQPSLSEVDSRPREVGGVPQNNVSAVMFNSVLSFTHVICITDAPKSKAV